MQARNPRFVLMSMVTAAICGCLATAPIQAADPACKGLEQAKCATTDGCAWTDDYTRKDGKTVAGYCHKIGKQGAAAKAKAPEPVPPAAKVPAAGKAAEPLPPVKAPAATSTGTSPATAPKSP
jgi:hypothetical protein